MAGEALGGDDLMLKRGFKGDAGVYEACVSEDGKLMVVLDTRQDAQVRYSIGTLGALPVKHRFSSVLGTAVEFRGIWPPLLHGSITVGTLGVCCRRCCAGLLSS